MSAGAAVRTLLSSSPIVWFDVVRTGATAAVVEIGLRTVSLARIARVLGVQLRLDGASGGIRDLSQLCLTRREQQRLDVAWRVLRRRPFNGTCLRRALVGARILRKRDHAVRIGVRKADGRIAAHAWIEIDGVSLDPAAIDTFKALAPVRIAR